MVLPPGAVREVIANLTGVVAAQPRFSLWLSTSVELRLEQRPLRVLVPDLDFPPIHPLAYLTLSDPLSYSSGSSEDDQCEPVHA